MLMAMIRLVDGAPATPVGGSPRVKCRRAQRKSLPPFAAAAFSMLSISLPVAAAMAFRNSGSRSMGSENAAAESANQRSSARGWKTTLPHPQECSKRCATSYLPSRLCNLRAPRRLSGPQTRNGPGYASCAGPSRSVSGMACRTSCTQAAAPASAHPTPAAVSAGIARNFRPTTDQRTGAATRLHFQIAAKRT